MSMRAASQPSAKKSGRASSHQNSKSIAVLRAPLRELARQRCDVSRLCGPLAPQRSNFAPLAENLAECGEHAEGCARTECDEQHEDERRSPFVTEEVANGH